jgi:4-hydroxy-4-methyl-2-oxoglutarate aldolase
MSKFNSPTLAADPSADLACKLVDRLKTASAAAAYEALGKRGDVAPSVRALVSDLLCVGPAFTVQAHPGFGDDITEATDAAPPGSVIVIDIGPGQTACTWGGTGSAIAQRRGIAGVVSNGHVRDIAEIRRARFPVFAAGTAVSGWRRGRRGALQIPVSIGGQIVQPGDLVCADDDGVVILAKTLFEAAYVALGARLQFENEAEAIVQAGGSYADIMQRKPGVSD